MKITTTEIEVRVRIKTVKWERFWRRDCWPTSQLASQDCDDDGASACTRVTTHKVHHTIAATRQTEARKFLASLS
jgi:hypothetical protein